MKILDRTTLQQRLDANPGLVLLEALPARYYDDAHLPRAKLFSHDQVDVLAPLVLPDKSAEIVVYCANLQCRNSHIAAGRLVQLGYANVAVYAAGKVDWIEAGLPVERAAVAA